MASSSMASVHNVPVETTWGWIRDELQIIWDEIGETDAEKDKMLLELEQECLEVYRRKLDHANQSRTQLRQTIADSEAELADICSAMGEQPVHIREFDHISVNLKEELKQIIPQLDEMRKRHIDRSNQFLEVLEQIEKLSNEIYSSEYIEPKIVVDEADLSLRKLEDLHRELNVIQSMKLKVNDTRMTVSMAICKAGAIAMKIPLYKYIASFAGNQNLVIPVPAFNIITGDYRNKMTIQELMFLPVGASTFREASRMGIEVYYILKTEIKNKYGKVFTDNSDDRGFAPYIQDDREGLELLNTAIAKAGYTGQIVIGIDVGASKFYDKRNKTYDLNFKGENNDGSQRISGDALKNVYKSFVRDFPIASIANPFDQDDWDHYAKMTDEMGQQVQIVGDDVLATNPKLVEKAIKEKTCNALLLKVNQISSVAEIIENVKMSKGEGWGVVIGSRMSDKDEDEDPFLADLSVGLATGQIKLGDPREYEVMRLTYRLSQIEKELGSAAVYAGLNFRAPV